MKVKASAKGGPYDAKMTRFAQGQLGPFLEPAALREESRWSRSAGAP